MKTEVSSYRMSSRRKVELGRAARQQSVKIAGVIDVALDEWLAKQRNEVANDKEQKRLHSIAEKYFGVVKGKNPRRSASVSKLMQQSLRRQYGR